MDLRATLKQFAPHADEVEQALSEIGVPNQPPEPVKTRTAKPASAFGEDDTKFLWYPYLPVGDYSVLMAPGGVGKTVLCCGIAAAVSSGVSLPGDEFQCAGQNVLIISAEDRGELLKRQLSLSGADLDRVYILDCGDSIGMDFAANYGEFAATVKEYSPALVIVDPWHAFLGSDADINRANVLRPLLQKLSHLAKECECAMLLVSHVNKRAQGENANNAATGSSDFINAARSAFRLVFDERDEDCRVLVHTKSNYAAYGKSVRYRISDGGVVWEGFSEITKQTLELAARRRSTPWEVMQEDAGRGAANTALIEALENSANGFDPIRLTYEELKETYGELIFGGSQPKRALDNVTARLTEDGYFLQTGIQVRRGDRRSKGFLIQRVDISEPEQIPITQAST